MLVTNHAACKVKEYIARQKGLESGSTTEKRTILVNELSHESLGRQDLRNSSNRRRGLGSVTHNISASPVSFDTKVQIALSKRLQNSCREPTSKTESRPVQDEASSEEESKTKYQKTRRQKKKLSQENQRKAVTDCNSTKTGLQHSEKPSFRGFLDESKQKGQGEDRITVLETSNCSQPEVRGDEEKSKEYQESPRKNFHKKRKLPRYF